MAVDIRTDKSRCTGCGLCAEVCPGFIRGAGSEISTPDAGWVCSCCGHCAAVCPTQAITHSRLDSAGFEPIDRDLLPNYEQALALLKSRRSRREFKDQPVEREVIEKLLEAAAAAPAAMNKQNVHYTVVTDPQALRKLSEMGVNTIQRLDKLMRSGLGRLILRIANRSIYDASPHLLTWVKPILAGQDMVLYSAPSVILVHCRKSDLCASENTLYGAANILTTAETLGLGACVIGFITESIKGNRRMRHMIGIPDDHAIYTTIAVGYPRFIYSRTAPKEPPKTHWISSK